MKLKSWLELSKDDNNWHKFQLDMSDSLRVSVFESSARILRYHVEIVQPKSSQPSTQQPSNLLNKPIQDLPYFVLEILLGVTLGAAA